MENISEKLHYVLFPYYWTGCEQHWRFCGRWPKSHHMLSWPTGSEWHCTSHERQSHHMFSYDQQQVSDIAHFCERQSHHISSYDQQGVSDIANFVKGSLIKSFPMTNLTACWWHCIFFERQSDHILSHDQQLVSDIAHFVKGSLIIYFPTTNRKWVTLHILWKGVSSHLFL